MRQQTSLLLTIAFVTPLFAVGLPYWMIPYNKVNVQDALVGPGLSVVCISALLLRLFNVATFWKTTKLMAATVPAAVMLRVMVEGIRDPTSHNLWPFEVIIAGLVGMAGAVPGVMVGSLLMKLWTLHDGVKTRRA